ncbi:Immunoglobulin Heavy Constant Alpha 1 [Manis pentadactyla]|nr:Immunoglobulin Heavy Constant Alpha 1 [Manis pentadactyla]
MILPGGHKGDQAAYGHCSLSGNLIHLQNGLAEPRRVTTSVPPERTIRICFSVCVTISAMSATINHIATTTTTTSYVRTETMVLL